MAGLAHRRLMEVLVTNAAVWMTVIVTWGAQRHHAMTQSPDSRAHRLAARLGVIEDDRVGAGSDDRR
jgi:hypothetical protein